MKDEKFNAIVGLIAGLETAVVTLAKAMQEQGVIKDIDRVAEVFEQQIQALPENREMIAMVLAHVVSGLRDPGHDPSSDLSRRLH